MQSQPAESPSREHHRDDWTVRQRRGDRRMRRRLVGRRPGRRDRDQVREEDLLQVQPGQRRVGQGRVRPDPRRRTRLRHLGDAGQRVHDGDRGNHGDSWMEQGDFRVPDGGAEEGTVPGTRSLRSPLLLPGERIPFVCGRRRGVLLREGLRPGSDGGDVERVDEVA